MSFGQKWSFEMTEILLIAKILSLAWTNEILFPEFILIEVSKSDLRFDRFFFQFNPKAPIYHFFALFDLRDRSLN